MPLRQTALLQEAAPTAIRDRLDDVVVRFLRPSRHVVEVVVGHGNLIRAVVCRAIGVRLGAW